MSDIPHNLQSEPDPVQRRIEYLEKAIADSAQKKDSVHRLWAYTAQRELRLLKDFRETLLALHAVAPGFSVDTWRPVP